MAGFESLFWLIFVSFRQSQMKRPLSLGSPREIRKSFLGANNTDSMPYLWPVKCFISVYSTAFLTVYTSYSPSFAIAELDLLESAPPAFSTSVDCLLMNFICSSSWYVISQIVIWGYRKALSPAAKYFPSLEKRQHWKGRQVREAKNLTCLASRGE